MTELRLPAPSIVLEWETVLEGGVDRARMALHEIGTQIAELQPTMDGQPELVICYDLAVISSEDVGTLIQEAFGPTDAFKCNLLLCPVPSGTDYYEKKNWGALRSRNNILLFLDTDLLPERGWLRGMLQPFLRWEIAVVVGATHLDHVSTYDMAVALFWIFLPALPEGSLRATRRLVSNNIAFRRAVFARFPFPKRPTYRGQCTELGLQLMAVGITMYEQTGARASHPPPAGLQGFIHRAWSAGRDENFYSVLSQKTSLATCGHQLCHDYRMVAQRIRQRSKTLKPNILATMLGWMLGWAYYGIKAAGYLTALWHTNEEDMSQHSTA